MLIAGWPGIEVAWTATEGADENAMTSFAAGDCDRLRAVEPAAGVVAERLAGELVVSLAHLRETEARYYDHGWRREHKGGGFYPGQALHDAVSGYLDLLAATQSSGLLTADDAGGGVQWPL